jgi:hypothetical protein
MINAVATRSLRYRGARANSANARSPAPPPLHPALAIRT